MKARKKPLADLREDYQKGALDEEALGRDPLAAFGRWFDEAHEKEPRDANAMVLATVDASGVPNARVVLLKGVEDGAFLFFTNYESDKGRELDARRRAALVFHWGTLERQVRIRGRVKRASLKVSSDYFASRPRGSQLAALASAQSRVLASRSVLEREVERLTAKYEGASVPRPLHWGGYLLVPESIEFWQGRVSRLHDRVRFRRVKGRWKRERLSP